MIFVIRGPMRRFVNFKPEVRVEGGTVKDGLSALCQEYPDLQHALLDASGQLRGVHRLALNRTVLHRSELETPVDSGDVLEVVTALAGG